MNAWKENHGPAGDVRPTHLMATAILVSLLLLLSPLFAGCGATDAAATAGDASPTDTPTTVTRRDEPSPDTSPSNVQSADAVVPLHVSGAYLVDAQGQPKQLRGVSTHGIAWFPQYVNGDLFGWLKEDWDINTVRLSMYTAESDGYCTDGDRARLTDLMRQGIDAAIAHDLYVIVDWHTLSDNDPNTHVEEAKEFFSAISKEYAGKANVLYEICNEPNGATNWDDVKRYAGQVIPAIRANDADAVVLVGTPDWDQDLADAQRDPLDFDNVMYTLHFYANEHSAQLRDRLVAAVEAGTPIFVSEFGTTDAGGNGTVNTAAAENWLDVLDRYHVSYVIWSLSDKEESSALFTTDNSTHPTESDLSEQGRWYRGYLRAHADRQ
ncbi:glycoside hydrolase family 5 protein [Bifidobacterium cuniculi]|uniref:cellulase n=1 Tax=Bifidobacterium cuniculi TaxID=1688 RepID=A0A087AYL5_9BIFI|nr:glycoside hydrolase family 5 protein [Bifidobacterium cuniculi]KFI63865.1 endo-1,4-beta-glucanase [Bifidobacterium cuniculi]